MTTLTRWEPFSELATMREMMDRFMDEPFFRTPTLWQRENGSSLPLALDVVEHENDYVVKASMPGIKPGEVEITLDNNQLTIKGESKGESEKQEGTYRLRERRYGSFYRNVVLPTNVKAEAIEAVSDNGILTITLPKAEESKPKKIAVKNTINQ